MASYLGGFATSLMRSCRKRCCNTHSLSSVLATSVPRILRSIFHLPTRLSRNGSLSGPCFGSAPVAKDSRSETKANAAASFFTADSSAAVGNARMISDTARALRAAAPEVAAVAGVRAARELDRAPVVVRHRVVEILAVLVDELRFVGRHAVVVDLVLDVGCSALAAVDAGGLQVGRCLHRAVHAIFAGHEAPGFERRAVLQ